jgi:hypothetical protein
VVKEGVDCTGADGDAGDGVGGRDPEEEEEEERRRCWRALYARRLASLETPVFFVGFQYLEKAGERPLL